MQKTRLIVPFTERFRIFDVLQKEGNFEFSEIPHESLLWSSGAQKEQVTHKEAQLEQAILFLENYEQKKGVIKTLREGSVEEISAREAQKRFAKVEAQKIEEKVTALRDSLVQKKGDVSALLEEKELLREWKTVPHDFSILNESVSTTTVFVETPLKDENAFVQKIEPLRVHLVHMGEGRFSLTCHHCEQDALESILKEFSVKKILLPNVETTIAERLIHIDRHIETLQVEIQKDEQKAEEYASYLPLLRGGATYLLWEQEKLSRIEEGGSTKKVLVYEGWVPKKQLNTLRDRISSVTNAFELEPIESKEGEVAPVEIENKGIFKPFEAVTRLYGLPGPQDIDPTAFLSGFFFIFFGFALSDVGYGITLALVSFGLVFFAKLARDTKLLLTLLGFGGISSAFFGVLFGGYLGIPLEYLPGWLVSLKQFDPISSPIQILLLALGLGVVQILVGLVLDIVRAAKNNNLLDGLLDKGPWIYFFIAVFSLLAATFGYLPALSFPYSYFVYVGVALLVLTQGRNEKSILGKIFKGVFSLYDSVGYFSDILSYSRLLALGLATTAISFAVDTIALIVRDLVPVVGIPLMVLILVGGHLFNLAVNTLGAFIHGARLQFVEFFTKFITGTGRTFKPFSRQERFILLNND